mgnify:CR=1 FL=1
MIYDVQTKLNVGWELDRVHTRHPSDNTEFSDSNFFFLHYQIEQAGYLFDI